MWLGLYVEKSEFILSVLYRLFLGIHFNKKDGVGLSRVDEELALTISNLEKIASSNTAEAMKFVVENVCSEYWHLVTETIYK